MPTIYLVRHGIAEGQEGCAVGHCDLPLSARGAEAIRRLAATWEGAPPDAFHASDLQRAQESAKILGSGWHLSILSDPRLREMSFGEWDGLPWEELHARDGERFATWTREWWTARVPGGEGYPDLAVRARAWLAEILAAKPHGTIVAVAHGGSIRALLAQALEMPAERIFNLRLDHAHVTGLTLGARGLEVLFVNADRFPRVP
jgi:alpha-ribazole phosphatase